MQDLSVSTQFLSPAPPFPTQILITLQRSACSGGRLKDILVICWKGQTVLISSTWRGYLGMIAMWLVSVFGAFKAPKVKRMELWRECNRYLQRPATPFHIYAYIYTSDFRLLVIVQKTFKCWSACDLLNLAYAPFAVKCHESNFMRAKLRPNMPNHRPLEVPEICPLLSHHLYLGSGANGMPNPKNGGQYSSSIGG